MQRERRNRTMPTRPLIRLIPPAPPRHVVFPVDVGDESTPASTEPAPPISHVARRRVSSVPAHEVELEELELLDESPDDSGPIAAPVAVPVTAVAPWQPPSLAPVVFDPPPIPVPLVVPELPVARRGRAIAAGGAVAMLALGIAIGAILRTDGIGGEAAPPAQAAAVTPASAAPPPEVAPPVPVVAVSSLPRASVGTVIGAEGHRLWVDGHLAESFTAVVACGRHVVKVGSAGTPRDVDVPCGEGIAVSP